MTTQGSTFVTTSRSDPKYIGRNRARKFQNPKFQSLIHEVWVVFIMIHHHGEVPGIERNKTHIFSCHGVARIEKFSRVFLPPIRLIFGPLMHTLWLKSSHKTTQGARQVGGELNSSGPAAGSGRRKKIDPGRVRGFLKLDNLYRRIFRR